MPNSTPGFADLPAPASGPDHFLTALQDADWDAFSPARDLAPLRTALVELEKDFGVTEAHRFATEQVKASGPAVLRHPDGHLVEITAFALSPDARYLAVGSWCGDDYEHGGILQVWELATGRCVNKLDRIEGGVGWPGHARNIQWSPDGRRVALAFNTNGIGLWDPFGSSGEPIADAYVTDGGNRPPEFAFAPDGTRAYIGMRAPGEVHGCLAPLGDGHFFYNAYDEDGPQPGWLARTLPPAIRQRLGDEELFFEQAFWSRDGSRIYGHSRRGWAASIDVASGQVAWLDQAETHGQAPAWSLDERLVAVHLSGRVVIADALTGALVTELPGHAEPSRLCWGAGGRLAVVVAEGYFPRVVVHDPDRRSHHLRVAPKEPDWELPDASPWAWSPNGLYAACLTVDDQIEVWSLGPEPQRVDAFDVPEETTGVVWGAAGVLVAVGRKTLRFVQAATGDVTGDFCFLREPYGQRPLELDGDDAGAEMEYEEHGDPTFVLDDDNWAAAFAPGLVIAPDGRRADLDALLAWVVDRRYSWPTRWGSLEIVPSAAVAAERLGPPYSEYLEPFLDAPEPAPAESWPPANTATVEDLFRLALESTAPLHSGWDHHVSQNLRHAARLRARRGETRGALDLLDAIPTPFELVRGHAEVALILGASGRVDEARSAFRYSDADVEDVVDEYNVAFIASAVGGACAAVGDAGRSAAWFSRALEAIEPETNPGEHRLAVAWALLECGRVDEARTVWQGATTTPSSFYTTPFLAYLVLSGRDSLAREVLTLKGTSGTDYVSYAEDGTQEYLGHVEEGWYDGWEGVEVLAALGRPDLIEVWAGVFGDGYAYEDKLEEAARNARLNQSPRPTPADISGLVDEYGTLLKTPRARREHPTAELARRAAECRHLGAVVNLISALPAEDFNGRPSSAFRALWIATTNVDVEPW